MENEKIINRHDEQIDSIKSAMSDIAVKLSSIVIEYNYLSKKTEEIWEVIKEFKGSYHQLKSTEMELDKLKNRLFELEKLISIPPYTKFFLWVKNWWFLWMPLLTALGWVGDLLYRFPHK